MFMINIHVQFICPIFPAKFGPRSNFPAKLIWAYTRNIFCKMGSYFAGTIGPIIGPNLALYVSRTKFAMT